MGMQKPAIVYGVDPGLKGGVTRIETATGLVTCTETPIIKGKAARKGPRGGKIPAIKDEYDPAAMAALIEGPEDVMGGIGGDVHYGVSFWIERVGAMPGQGVTSMFRFGFGAGLWHGICGARRIVPNLISPGPWKASFGLNDDKNAARAKATEIAPALAGFWPLVKHDGVAESFLIAHYAVLQLGLNLVYARDDRPGSRRLF
jgi:crossover junction endodeoxyribonuclease RuvC